ncbi:hypothetical protein CEN39_15910 [Fischerella thermalis CCMEE 5201]|jgi:serine/threonine-protein kinase|nr:hypothetical protein CEN39_15910 [Fischerella thermalis CCMEE 5201]
MFIGKILLNRYKITSTLGSGGFGDTYKAIDLALPNNHPCVVKQLKPKDPRPEVFPIAKALFEREAETLYHLGEHDQIPRLYAHFEEGDDFFLVEEFVDGHDLSQEIILGQPWSEQKTVKLLQEILEVLTVVHQQNVIHRDIKPANIRRRQKDGKLVLIDFGAVKQISVLTVNHQGQTSLTAGIGSPGYIPSEQAKGKPKLASDIYAVGIIGIQALTGMQPYQLSEDPNTGEIIWRNYAQVSDRLADVLSVMVSDHFSQRYQNASEALQALIPTPIPNSRRVSPSSHQNQQFQSSQQVLGRNVSSTNKTTRPKQSKTKFWEIGAVLLLVGTPTAIWLIPNVISILQDISKSKPEPTPMSTIRIGQPPTNTPNPGTLNPPVIPTNPANTERGTSVEETTPTPKVSTSITEFLPPTRLRSNNSCEYYA